jgi:uncharacterized protein YndB with AHSA1/START domain
MSKESGLTKDIQINAPATRVFQALSTAEGLGKWWSYYTTGPSCDNGEVLMKWPASGHHARVRLAEAKAPTFVEWSVIEHRPFNESDGTAIRFSLEEAEPEKTKVILRHIGMTPELGCYQVWSDVWSYLMGQIKKLVEQGFL